MTSGRAHRLARSLRRIKRRSRDPVHRSTLQPLLAAPADASTKRELPGSRAGAPQRPEHNQAAHRRRHCRRRCSSGRPGRAPPLSPLIDLRYTMAPSTAVVNLFGILGGGWPSCAPSQPARPRRVRPLALPRAAPPAPPSRAAPLPATCPPWSHPSPPWYVAAGAILTVMMVPQIWQVWRTRRADDLSHVFLSLFNFGEQGAAAGGCVCVHGGPARESSWWTHLRQAAPVAGWLMAPLLPPGRSGAKHASCPAGLLMLLFYNIFLGLTVYIVAGALQLGEAPYQ